MNDGISSDYSDLDIQALVDGALEDDQKRRMRQVILNNPHAATRYEQLMEQKNLLLRWWNKTGGGH